MSKEIISDSDEALEALETFESLGIDWRQVPSGFRICKRKLPAELMEEFGSVDGILAYDCINRKYFVRNESGWNVLFK